MFVLHTAQCSLVVRRVCRFPGLGYIKAYSSGKMESNLHIGDNHVDEASYISCATTPNNEHKSQRHYMYG
jgi:hypothetical protein